MSRRFRFRDEEESSSTSTVLAVIAGAIGGFALGMYVAQRVGGLEGLTAKLRKVRGAGGKGAASPEALTDHDEFDDIEEDDLEGDEADQGLEERVLEAYKNDPILAERAVDIGSIGEGIIELAGWVDTEDESEHAVTIARGIPGVDTVVNRLAIGSEEEQYADTLRAREAGDASLNDHQWEGNTIGTGRRRQGNSDELDRHADPKVEIESRWEGKDEALRQAADDAGVASARRKTSARSVRSAPVAPSGVPKADHVANPVEKAD